MHGYIYPHEWADFYGELVGKHSSPMDPIWVYFLKNWYHMHL